MDTNHSLIIGRINARSKRLVLVASDCAFEKELSQCDDDELQSRQIYKHLVLLNQEDHEQLDLMDELDQPLTFLKPPSEAFLLEI